MNTFDKAVFAAGPQTDSEGRTRMWSVDDLRRIAERYGSRTEDAPIVLGHPEDNSPAYGWVKALYVKGSELWATIKSNADGKIIDWLKAGYYRMVSISLYDNLDLRHIGFLGGARPAVAGLPDAKVGGEAFTSSYKTRKGYHDFSITNRTFAMPPEFDLAEWQTWRTGIDSTLQGIQTSLDEIKKALPTPDSNTPAQAQDQATTNASEEQPADHSKESHKLTPQVLDLQKQVNALRADNAIASFSAWLNSDEIRRKIAPAQHESVLATARKIVGSFDFSKGGEKVETLESYRDMIKSLPDVVPSTQEFAKNGDSRADGDAVKDRVKQILGK